MQYFALTHLQPSSWHQRDDQQPQEKTKKQALVEQQKDQTEKLLKRNENLERKLAEVKGKDDKETITMLMAHIHELYSMYDSL